MIINKIKTWWRSLTFYVIVDPHDNSVTISKHLFRHIKKHNNATNIFVFRLSTKEYGFIVNPDIQQATQYCEIQYNEKYKCIGFETLCPSVGLICYDYDLPIDKPLRLSVVVEKLSDKTYYKMIKPNAKHIRKYT